MAIWKEAGFFMIFYLAALQQIPPALAEAAALEGASRWHYFRRVHLPAADADHAVRAGQRGDQLVPLVDHLFVMTTGGPDNASTLLLYYIYQVGFSFWDTGLRGGADRGAAGDPRRSSRSSSSASSTGGSHYR